MKISALLICLLVLTHAPARAAMSGDLEAIAMAAQLVEGIGGSELWSRIRSLHVFEKSRSLKGDGIVGEFWRDLQVPQERYTLRNRNGLTVEFGWDKEHVWQHRNGTANDGLPENIHQMVLDYWPGEIYVMYHRLAKQDSSLRLEKNQDNSFTAFDSQANRRLGTFWLNEAGEMYRWQHDDGTEYIYGPHRQFGEISFPDWGTQVDGSWSFYYVDVRWSEQPHAISYREPAN